MAFSGNFQKLLNVAKKNSPEILTAFSISGLITTSYLTHKAAVKATNKCESESPYMSNKERAKLVWKFYVPPAISGAATIACIIASSRANTKRTAAAVTAYSLTERAFSEYKERVVEQIGKGAEQKIRDEIAQEKVNDNPPSKEIVIVGNKVLCCELYTARYFQSDMESLRKAENQLNAELINGVYASLDNFYDIVGLPYTSQSAYLGWTNAKLLELRFTTTLAPDGTPCLAFDYNYVEPIR